MEAKAGISFLEFETLFSLYFEVSLRVFFYSIFFFSKEHLHVRMSGFGLCCSVTQSESS